jgi:anthranilate phosphoribosyltransferase
VLAGRGASAHTDAVALNAGALLWVAGKTRNLREGTRLALEVLGSGRAGQLLRDLAEMTGDA